MSSASVDDWTQQLAEVGVAAGRVGSIADAFDLAERLGLEPVVHPAEARSQVRSPIRLSQTPITRYLTPPTIGQHNDTVRQWLLKETNQ